MMHCRRCDCHLSSFETPAREDDPQPLRGLGSLISYYSNTFDANGVFAVLLILVVLADLLSMLMTRLERRLTRWRG